MAVTRPAKTFSQTERRRILLGAGALCLGILALAAFSCWNFSVLLADQARSHAIRLTHLSISKDLALRAWVSDIGGIYAPVTPGTPPNPWLPPKNRDFTLPDGITVTRINPAYAFRLVQERWMEASTGRGRLVSLKPIRPDNRADPWEAVALEELIRTGGEEKLSLEKTDGQERIRLIHALRAKQQCLTCHSAREHKEGDVLGGLSVSPPLEEMARMHDVLSGKITLVHLLFALLCMLGVVWFSVKLLRRIDQRDKAQNELQRLADDLEQRVDERTRQLYASEAHSLRLLNATSDGIIGVDTGGNISFANRAAQNMLGYAENELIGRNLHETLHPFCPDGSHNPRESCTLCRARLGSDEMRFTLESFLHKSGDIVLVSGSIAPILEENAATGSILAFHDVGEAYKSELWQRIIFDSAGEAFFIWDEKRKLQSCNAAAVKWLGASSKEEVLARIKEFQPTVQEDGTTTLQALEDIFSLCDQKGMVHTSWTCRHADGTLLPCEAVLVRLTSPLGLGYFASLHDLRKIRSLQRSAADQPTIHIRLGKQLRRIFCVH